MRYFWLAAILILIGEPARADVTARFSQPHGAPIVIQVNDRGDSRMAVTDGVYLSRNGETHMILTMDGDTFVARQDDFLALLAELTALRGPVRPAGGRVGISAHGRETVGGRSGAIFRVTEAGRPESLEFVISADADLAPVGRVFRDQFLRLFAAEQANPPAYTEAMSDLLSRGTLIRFGALFRLEAVESAPVPASAFELPSAPISRDALRERFLGAAGR